MPARSAAQPSEHRQPMLVPTRCNRVRYLGGPRIVDDLHIADGRELEPGEVVTWPGVFEGRTDRTPSGGHFVVRDVEVYPESSLVYAVAYWEPSAT